MTKSKVLLCIVFGFLLSSNLEAQSHDYIGYHFKGSLLLGAFEVDQKIVVVESNGLNVPLDQDQGFAVVFSDMEIDESTNEIAIQEYHRIELDEGFQVFAIDYILESKEWIMVMANNMGIPEEKVYRIQVYSNTLQLKTEREVITAGDPLYFYFDTHNGKTSMIGYVFDPFNDKLVYAEYRHAVLDGLSSILVGQSHPNKMFWLTSMNYDPITGNMLTFHYNGVSILDSTLYQVAYHDRLKILTSDNGDVMRVGDNYFTHGARDSSWQDGRRRMVLHKYDTAFTILKADTLGWHVWDNFPFIVKSMDIQDSTILIGGNLDGPFNGGDFFTRKKKFYLAKYNLTLDQIWYKEYGGDLAYILNGLELLSIGSSVAYGFISDTVTNIRYSYLLYVDENGDIISSLEVPSSTMGPHLDVVNPGDDRMTILNPDGLDAHILVYTINGKMVINTSLQPDKTSLDLSAWPAGMYPYVFYLDDKPVKSGKWVKKE